MGVVVKFHTLLLLLQYKISNDYCDQQYMTSEIIMHSFTVTSANVAINDISQKTRFYGLHFCCRQYSSMFNHFYVIGLKTTEFDEITQNKGHYTVQGHSRSPILVPIESSCVISYERLILTYLLPPYTVSELLQIIGQILAFDRRYTLVQGEPLNSGP